MDFWEIHDQYYPRVKGFILGLVRDESLTDDLVQETFLAALKAQDGFRGSSSERTWLTSILKRKIIDSYRKKYSSKETAFGSAADKGGG